MMPCTFSGSAVVARRRRSRRAPHVLLRVERVAAGAASSSACVSAGSTERSSSAAISRAISSSESGDERDGGGVALAAAPAGTALEQLGPRRADDQQRHGDRPVGEVVDEVEQPVVGPVQVLEDQHGRPHLAERLEEAPPRREALLSLAAAGSPASPSSGRRCARPTRASLASATSVVDRLAELRLGLPPRASVSSMPACALTISPSAQKLMPAPYGSSAPAATQMISESASTSASSSAISRLLPMPGTPMSVTSCACSACARVRAPRAACRARASRPTSSACAPSSTSTPKRARGATASQAATRLGLALGRRPARPRRYSIVCARRAVGRLADEHAVDRRRGLQPGGGVDDVADDQRLALVGARVERDQRLAGV